MIIDLERDVVAPVLDADICIVGGGAIGLCMAITLARHGVDVLVLEAGGAQLEAANQDMHQGESVGHPFESIGVGRYRVLGGSTTYWGGQVIPFDAFVVGARPWVGHAAWPAPAEVLARHVEQAQELLGLKDVEADDAMVWRGMKLPVPALAPEVDTVLTRWVPVRNLARHFARELRTLPKLRVLLHANVVALELTPDRSHVAQLSIRTRDGKQAAVRPRQVVLAHGTFEIARLLLHPLADGAVAPWGDSPWLGRPLIDHLDSTAAQVRVIDQQRFHAQFDNIYFEGFKYFPRMRLPPAVQRAEGLYDCGANFLYRTRFTEHLEVLKMFLRSLREGGVPASALQLPRHLSAVISTTLPLAFRYFRDRRSFKPADAEVSLALYCEQAPNANSSISLGDTVDALGLRRLRVHWAIDGRELRTMKAFALRIDRALRGHGLAELTIDPKLLDESVEFLTGVHDAVHQMGSTRMGLDRTSGFVDPDLRVFGIDNLSVAGAAVFPSSGFANPTLTAVALALRLAGRLAEHHRHG